MTHLHVGNMFVSMFYTNMPSVIVDDKVMFIHCLSGFVASVHRHNSNVTINVYYKITQQTKFTPPFLFGAEFSLEAYLLYILSY